MGVALFTRSSLFLQSKTCPSDTADGHCIGREFVASTTVQFSNNNERKGYVTSLKRYVTEKVALEWFSKLHAEKRIGQRSPSSFLALQQEGQKPYSHVASSYLDEKRVPLSKAAQKRVRAIRKRSGILRRQEFNEQLTENVQNRGGGSDREASESSAELFARNGGRGQTVGEDECFRRGRGDRRPSSGVSGWKLYAVGVGTATCAVAAAKGFQSGSAQASCGDGSTGQSGGGGHGGEGWNGGGGDSGGFNSRGESFFGDSMYSPTNEEKEERSRSVRIGKRGAAEMAAESEAPNRKIRSLASLSSAAGDFIDGEAPIGGTGTFQSKRYSSSEEVNHLNRGPYGNAATHFDSSVTGDDRHKIIGRNFDQSNDPFLTSDSGGMSLPQRTLSPGFEQDDKRKGSFEERSGSPDSLSASSGKPLSPKTYSETYESNESRRMQSQYNTFATSEDSHPLPRDYPSIEPYSRAKYLSEPPRDFQERVSSGTVSSAHDQNQAYRGIDFSDWVAGLFNSIAGKRAGGQEGPGTGEKNFDDNEKKALIAETAALALQLLSEEAGDHGLAKKFETSALRRLQRETFTDLLKIRERIEKLERHSGFHQSKTSGDSSAGVRTVLKGEVSSGGAFVIIQDSNSNHSRASLQHAGMLTGLDVRFTFETPMREGDMLTTQCGVGHFSGESEGSVLGGPITLQKISYLARINDTLSLSVAPLGARANDMSDTVNHLQGQALTTFAGGGPALYQHLKGSAIGASLRSTNLLLSMSQFLSGWGSMASDVTGGPLLLSTLAQFMVQPCEQLVFSLSAVNNLWPSPPLPSSSGFHWSEMGPLVLCKSLTRPTGAFYFNPLRSSTSSSVISQGNLPTESWSPDGQSLGVGAIGMQSVALAGEVDLGGHISLGGWVQVERGDWLQELEKKDFQWNVSLAKCTVQNVHWGLSIGRRKREDWHDDGLYPIPSSGPYEPSPSQMQMEAFVRLNCGKGFSIQPGLVYILDKYSQTPAMMLRSSWTM